MTDEPALKPCPFCGCSGSLSEDYGRWKIECDGCGANAGWNQDPLSAAAWWNQRKDAAPLPPPRTITQLCPDATGDLLALCNDGTVLRWYEHGFRWIKRDAAIPQE
jgi:hypothetical protein